MTIHQIRLIFNLYFIPSMLFVAAMVVWSTVDRLDSSPMLLPLVMLIHWAFIGLLVAAVSTFGWGTWKISQALRGVGELCHSCGMPTRLISPGRYSPHYRCMACGLNRRA